MALTFPRDLTDGTCWERVRLRLEWRQELSRQAGGLVQGKDLGSPIWQLSCESYPLDQAAVDALEAEFETLEGVAWTFLAVPPRNRRPRLDTGSGDVTGGVFAIRGDARGLKLDGLPESYDLSPGDLLSIKTVAGGYELHRLARSGEADGLGQTGWIEVVPPIRPSVSTGDAVRLTDPPIEMRLSPGGVSVARVNRRRWRLSFDAVQVIR